MENNLLKKHYKEVYKYTRNLGIDREGKPITKEIVDLQIVANAENDSRCFNVVKTDTTIEYDRWTNTSYEALVSKLIRASYSIDDELAILRQKEEKPAEYQAYYEFAEGCKTQARAMCDERDAALRGE